MTTWFLRKKGVRPWCIRCRLSAVGGDKAPARSSGFSWVSSFSGGRPRLTCDATRAETRFRLSAKRTSPFKPAGASAQSTTGSRGVRISGSNAGYTMFWGSVRSTGLPSHSPVSPSLPLPCVIVCHHVSTRLYVNCAGGSPWAVLQHPVKNVSMKPSGSSQGDVGDV
jgi:hypothetical protein